jgi:hypothetical protein
MIHVSFKAAAIVISGLSLVGCHKSSPPPDTIAPMTMTPAAEPSLTMGKPPAAKDLTHELTKDQPLFASEPAAGAKPDGMAKAGSKVLVLIPGADYSQVVTDTGISAYTATDGLKPVGK